MDVNKSWDTHNSKNIKNCPHCGSDKGYQYTYVQKCFQQMDFNGHGFWNERGRNYSESRKKCVECKKIIKELT